MQLKNKMLITILLFLAIICIKNNCFATDYSGSFDDDEINTVIYNMCAEINSSTCDEDVVSDYLQVCYDRACSIVDFDINNIYIFNYSSYLQIFFTEDVLYYNVTSYKSVCGTIYFYASTTDGTLYKYSGNDSYGIDFHCDTSVLPCYNTSDILYYSDKETVYQLANLDFFSVAPQGVLAPIVEKQETAAVVEQIVKLIPIVMIVVVGFLGLRKALQILFNTLRAS